MKDEQVASSRGLRLLQVHSLRRAIEWCAGASEVVYDVLCWTGDAPIDAAETPKVDVNPLKKGNMSL